MSLGLCLVIDVHIFIHLSCLVPLLGNLLLPVLVLLDLVDSVFDDAEYLSNFKITHVLVVIKFICKL